MPEQEGKVGGGGRGQSTSTVHCGGGGVTSDGVTKGKKEEWVADDSITNNHSGGDLGECGFNSSILRHRRIRVAADEAVLNIVHEKYLIIKWSHHPIITLQTIWTV
jgi:hypothetical protein